MAQINTKLYRIDLKNGFTDHKLAMTAHRLEVVEASSAAALAVVDLINSSGEVFAEGLPVSLGVQIKTPENANVVQINATAQSGEWLVIMAVHQGSNLPVEFDYTKPVSGIVDQITNPVQVQPVWGNPQSSAATVNTAAVQVAAINGQKAISIFNNGSSVLYVGHDNTVTTNTGTPIAAGTSGMIHTAADLHLIGDASGQSSNARLMQYGG